MAEKFPEALTSMQLPLHNKLEIRIDFMVLLDITLDPAGNAYRLQSILQYFQAFGLSLKCLYLYRL